MCAVCDRAPGRPGTEWRPNPTAMETREMSGRIRSNNNNALEGNTGPHGPRRTRTGENAEAAEKSVTETRPARPALGASIPFLLMQREAGFPNGRRSSDLENRMRAAGYDSVVASAILTAFDHDKLHARYAPRISNLVEWLKEKAPDLLHSRQLVFDVADRAHFLKTSAVHQEYLKKLAAFLGLDAEKTDYLAEAMMLEITCRALEGVRDACIKSPVPGSLPPFAVRVIVAGALGKTYVEFVQRTLEAVRPTDLDSDGNGSEEGMRLFRALAVPALLLLCEKDVGTVYDTFIKPFCAENEEKISKIIEEAAKKDYQKYKYLKNIDLEEMERRHFTLLLYADGVYLQDKMDLCFKIYDSLISAATAAGINIPRDLVFKSAIINLFNLDPAGSDGTSGSQKGK